MLNRAAFSVIIALVLGGAHCINGSGSEDHVLFGLTMREVNENTSPAASCAAEIAVTTTTIELVEPTEGDVNRTYSTTDPYYTDADSNGGSAYGFRSIETCVYPVNAFTGTFEIPLTDNGNYGARMTVLTSSALFPLTTPASWPGTGAALPTKLVFQGNGTLGHGTGARQCFRITGVNDSTRNTGTQSDRTIALGVITTDSSNTYIDKNPCDVTARMEDDDGPGVRVSNISRVMEEPGGTGFNNATFTVRLRQAPTANVVVPITDTYDATNAGQREGIASPTSLTFTTGNWSVDQTVTVTSVDDLEVDGTKTYQLGVSTTSSADADYNGIDPRNVTVINNDKSVPGYTYTLWDLSTGNTTAGAGATVNGFATDEMGNLGNTYARFKIKLRSKPSASVQLNFTSNNTAISTVQTPTLTFTTSDWNVDQWVTVIGKSNGTDGGSGNGNIDYTVSFTTTTGDSTYNTIPKPSFVIRSCDNDNTHLIQPCNFSGSPYGDSRGRLSGAEPSATTYMWLITKSAPGSAVSVGLTSTDTTEGTVPASVTIDSGNYNMLTSGTNRIALTHVDDTTLDGTQTWDVTTAAATGGLTYDTSDVLAQTTDNEQRYYIKVTGTTKEATPAQTAKIDVCLGATNANNVQVNAACASADECDSVSPANVTFTPGQVISGSSPTNDSCASDANRLTFTVTGADDTYADGTQSFTVNLTVTTTDPVYSGNNPSNQSVSNEDNEPAGKAIFVYSTAVVGEMTASGVGGADNYCSTGKPGYAPSGTYKALIVSDSATNRRMATTTGTDSTGQVGWVLTPTYYYYRCESGSCTDEAAHLFIANSAGLIPFPMDRDFSTTGSHEFWTGMNLNMTAATQSSTPVQQGGDPDYRDNCAGWTYQNAPVNPFPGYYGQTWIKDGTGTIISNTNVACSNTRRIICVQQ